MDSLQVIHYIPIQTIPLEIEMEYQQMYIG